MTTILLILAGVLVVGSLAALVPVVRRDGLGRHRPPRSHPEWWEGTELH
ncbi:hypothetical protein [Isoptericola croceus]|nr:hypothetical protein [Isoptericola croceus]